MKTEKMYCDFCGKETKQTYKIGEAKVCFICYHDNINPKPKGKIVKGDIFKNSNFS